MAENTSLRTVVISLFIRENSKMGKYMVMELLISQAQYFTKVNSKMEKVTVLENISMQVV